MNITEQESAYNGLEKMDTLSLLDAINAEDQTVAYAVRSSIPQIEALVNAVYEKMQAGGRLFYIGAGTSGRLGIVDASECPPTFGVPFGKVIGLIAGGDTAIRKALEFAEDDPNQAWIDLMAHNINPQDFLVGIAASGRTPYVIGGLQTASENRISTGCIVCNPNSAIAAHSDYKVEVIVGPEFLTGSTRMKAGTAQKLVLNMLTTSVMIKLGHVKGNKMVDMALSNHKLVDRGVRMVMSETGLDYAAAEILLQKTGSVRAAREQFNSNKS